MNISASQALSHRPLRAKKPSRGDSGLWRDRRDEVRELLLFLDQERLEDAGRLLKSVGSGLKGAWSQIRDVPAKLFDLEVVSEKVDEDQQKRLLGWAETLGVTAGLVATGGHALGGALKLASGHQQRDTSRKLDGLVDIATGVTLAATVAGMSLARAALAPLAAALNMARGGYNAVRGFRILDEREQLQGGLDLVRSAGSVGRLLKGQAAIFKLAGVALAPLAGAIQVGRGMYDVSLGLRNDDNRKQLDGLVDMATAVGTGLAFASGAAVVPGMALAVAANLVKIAYQISPRARARIDPLIDKAEPKLTRMVAKVERFSAPLRQRWQSLMSRLVKDRQEPGPSRFSQAQLAEIATLLSCDGDYTRQEERRLKTRLERAGQGKRLPSHQEGPPPTQREQLLRELETPEQRRAFVAFMSVVALYDNRERAEEVAYIDGLARMLGVEAQTA